MTAKEYTIKTLEDFLTVPEDRLEDCLKEFKSFIEILRPIKDLIKATGDTFGVEAGAIAEAFVWIDDDKGNVTVRFGGQSND